MTDKLTSAEIDRLKLLSGIKPPPPISFSLRCRRLKRKIWLVAISWYISIPFLPKKDRAMDLFWLLIQNEVRE